MSKLSLNDLSLSNVKQRLNADIITFYLFGIFLSGFLWMPNTKVQRAFFVLFVVLPFIALQFKSISGLIKPRLIQLSISLIGLLMLSLLWTSGEPVLRPDKYISIGISTIIFVLISYYFFSQEIWAKSISLIIVAAVIVYAFSIVYFYQSHPFPSARLQNVFHNYHPVFTGHCAALVALMAIFKIETAASNLRDRAILIGTIILMLLALLLTGSRGPMLAFCMAASLLFLLKGPKYFLFFLVILIFVALAYWLYEPSLIESMLARKSSGRLEIYTGLINAVGSDYWFGKGVMSDDKIYQAWTVKSYHVHAHSIYLGTFFYTGIAGLSLLLCILLSGFYQGFQIYKNSNNWLPLIWLVFGAVCTIFDGQRLIRPYYLEWFLIWTPIALTTARYAVLTQQEANAN